MHNVNNKLLKLFSFTSVITLVIAVVLIGWVYRSFSINLLEEQSAENNALLSKIIYNSIHIGIETKLGVHNLYNDESIAFISDKRNHPFLTSIINDSIEKTTVVKVKIYDPKLKNIYSTTKENSGKIIDASNVIKVYDTGKSFTEIKHYEQFTIDGEIFNDVSLLTTYIPMLMTHEIEESNIKEYGLFGIYVNVTDRYQSIVNSQWRFVSMISLVLLIISILLYIEVRRINYITNKKQDDLDVELRKAEKTNLVLGKNFAKVATKRDRAVKENEAKRQFLANMSHELRTPLNAIIGYSEMISDDMDEGETGKVKEDSVRINSAGKHLLIIINDILDISKIEAGKMELNVEEFNINDMVRELVATSKPLADKNKNTIIVNSNQSVTSIESDLTRTRQILLNLLSNAIKFTKEGEISVSINDSTIDGHSSVEFVVQDSGIGLDAKYIEEIFSPFNQADSSSSKKYEGTGLGLTISKLFCELMNGTISVKSEIGHGSTFYVNIPRRVKVNRDNKVIVESNQRNIEYCASVLIIDKDSAAVNVLVGYLTNLKFHVITARDCDEGLLVIKNNHIDIMIVDEKIPDIDSSLIIPTLKNNIKTKNICIVLSASNDECDLTLSNNVDAFIIKPYNKEIVEETFCNIVGGSDSAVSVQ